MPTTFVMPIPKIGNHPTDCPCATCTNARKRLAASPYVQLLQRELLAAHNRIGEGSPAVVTSLEAQVLSLRELLAKRDDDNRILSNTLTESRKICQEREKQLTNQSAEIKNQALSQQAAATRAYNLATELRILAQAAGVGGHSEENWPKEIKRVLNDLIHRCELYKGQAERTGEANTALQAERDGYAADLKMITREANTQRLAADGAKAQVESLKKSLAVFEASTEAAYQDAMERERRAGWVETWAAAIVSGLICALAAFLVGRHGR